MFINCLVILIGAALVAALTVGVLTTIDSIRYFRLIKRIDKMIEEESH